MSWAPAPLRYCREDVGISCGKAQPRGTCVPRVLLGLPLLLAPWVTCQPAWVALIFPVVCLSGVLPTSA